jgi:hypothetical protein
VNVFIPTRYTRNIICSVNKYQHDSDVKTLRLCQDRSWLFRVVGRRWLVYGYRPFKTIYPSHLSRVMKSPVVYYRRSGTIIGPIPARPLKDGTSLTLEDGTHMLSQRICSELSTYAVHHPRILRTSSAPRQKPAISHASD